MGQLRLETEEIQRVGKLLGKEILIEDGELMLKLGDDVVVSLDSLRSGGRVEKNGVQFKLDIVFDSEGLKVGFE